MSTKIITRRFKGFLVSQFPGHILVLLFLWIILNVRVWVIFLLIYAGIITMAFLYDIFCAWRCKRERIYAKEVRRLMLLIRNLIDMAFIYDEDCEKFYRKFLEEVSVESLSRRGIIDPDALLRTPHYNKACKGMKRSDAELWTLIKAGFTSRELMVIYGLTNINSVYIKRNRLKSRLQKHMLDLTNNT